MMRKCLAFFLFLFLVLNVSVFAQDDDLQSAVNYKVNKMKNELKLTESQADAIRPIIKDYVTKRQAFSQDTDAQGIIDHVSVKESLRALKDKEYKELSQILSEDQMKKWKNKELVMATLNPDSPESTDDDSVGLNPNGANFKF